MYVIKNYKELYNPTNTSGGELKNAKYVKMPVKPRGKGLRALLKMPKGLEIFGIWALLLEVATETTNPKLRGKLLNHKDEPANINEIAESISLDRKTSKVEKALAVLVKMDWIEHEADTEEVQNGSVESPDQVPSKRSEAKTKISKDKRSVVEGSANSQSTGSRFVSDELKFYDSTCEIFCLTKKSDQTSMRKVAKFLRTSAMNGEPDSFHQAWEIAKESVKGDKPIALFISRMKSEMGYLRKQEI